MPMIAKLGIDKKKADAGLKQFEKDAKETGKRVNKELSKKPDPAKNVGNAKAGLEAAGVSGDKLGKIGAFAGAMGPMAIAGAAIGVVWQVASKALEYYVAKLKDAIDLSEKNAAENERIAKTNAERRASETAALDGLSKLSTVEELSNAQKKEAITLIETLSKRYKDFTVKIDKSGKSLIGFDDNLSRVLQHQKEEELADIERQLKNLNGIQKNARAIFDRPDSGTGSRLWNILSISGAEADSAVKSYEAAAEKIAGLKKRKREVEKTDPQKEENGYRLGLAAEKNAEADQVKKQTAAAAEAERWSKLSPEDRVKELTASLEKESAALEEVTKKYKSESDLLSEIGKTGRDRANQADLSRVELTAATAKVEMEKQAAKVQETQLKLAKERADLEKKAADFRKSHNDRTQDLRDRIGILQGKGQQVALEKALRDARESKGADLTDEERSKVSALSSLSYRLDNRAELKAPQFNNNELTARGGFLSAGASSYDRQMKAMADNAKRSNDLLNEIKTKLEDLGL